ncbi:hypothetical protein SH2C18_16090 [Clostridium sediminicola]
MYVANTNETINPNVGFTMYIKPPPDANQGIPTNPPNIYKSALLLALLLPNAMDKKIMNGNCNVKYPATGDGILINAPMAINDVPNATLVNSFVFIFPP